MRKLKRKKSILRIRSKFGIKTRFEMLFNKTNKHLYCQINDIVDKKTLFTATTISLSKDNLNKNVKSVKLIPLVSSKLVDFCKANNIQNISVNVANNGFQGIIKAFCEDFFQRITVKL